MTNYILAAAENGEGGSASFSFQLGPLPALIGIIAISLILLLAAYYLWDKTYRPARIAQRVSTPPFTNIFKRALNIAFKTDTSYLASSKNGGFLPWKQFNYGAIIFSYVFVPLGAAIGLPIWVLPIPLVITLLVIAGRVKTLLDMQDKALDKIFKIAKTRFKYRNADMEPWLYVKIEEWLEGNIPSKVVIVLPDAYDEKLRMEFEYSFNATAPESASYKYDWDVPAGIVTCSYAEPIPEMAPYHGSKHRPWDEIPLGIGQDGEVVWKVTKDPHMLIAGPTGSGKSVAQQNIIIHCIEHPDMWRFIGIDMKRVELTQFAKYDEVVRGIAVTREEGVQALRAAKDLMDKRYEQLEAAGLNNFKDLPVVPPAMMIMVDEGFEFMTSSSIKTEEGKQQSALAEEATELIGSIARLGRAAGIHMTIAMQRPDAKIFLGEIKNNFTARYAAGPMKITPSRMLMDSDAATRLNGQIKGRGVVAFNEREYFLQTYYSEGWLDQNYGKDYLNQNEEVDEETENSQGMYEDFDISEATSNANQSQSQDEDNGDEQPSPKMSLKAQASGGFLGAIKKAIDEFKDPDGDAGENPKNKTQHSDPKAKPKKHPKASEGLSDSVSEPVHNVSDSYIPHQEDLAEEELTANSRSDEISDSFIPENDDIANNIDDYFAHQVSEETKEDKPHSSLNIPTYDDHLYADELASMPDEETEDPFASSTQHELAQPEEGNSQQNTPAAKTVKNLEQYDKWDDDLEKLFTLIGHNIPMSEKKVDDDPERWGNYAMEDLMNTEAPVFNEANTNEPLHEEPLENAPEEYHAADISTPDFVEDTHHEKQAEPTPAAFDDIIITPSRDNAISETEYIQEEPWEDQDSSDSTFAELESIFDDDFDMLDEESESEIDYTLPDTADILLDDINDAPTEERIPVDDVSPHTQKSASAPIWQDDLWDEEEPVANETGRSKKSKFKPIEETSDEQIEMTDLLPIPKRPNRTDNAPKTDKRIPARPNRP